MKLMIYGASGYTGGLIAQAAVKQGLNPILAGRSQPPQAGQDYRVFPLAEAKEALHDIDVLLNCAGPFALSSKPLVEACLQTGTHYLDLAGEVPEFEALAAYDQQAQQAGIMIMPGVGFGVVPTDCMAVYLKQCLPSATHLMLAFQTEGGVSRGTLATVLKDLPHPGVERRDSQLIPAYAGSRKRPVDFGSGSVTTLNNPWRGDLSTAYRSTGIPNMTVYTAMPAIMRLLLSFRGLIGLRPVQNFIAKGASAGPDEAERRQGKTVIYGEVTDTRGKKVAARLHGPEAYDFTVLTATGIIRQNKFKAGFQTPAQVYGAEFVLNIPGVRLETLN